VTRRSPFVWWVRGIGGIVRRLEDYPAGLAFALGLLVGAGIIVLYDVL
jgi:hypothetical protein